MVTLRRYFLLFGMEVQNEGALLAFSRAGLAHDSTLPYQPQLIYSQTLLGSLFVRSYRLFRKDKANKNLIFLKRINMSTEYLFLKFLDCSAQVKPQYLNQIQLSVSSIRTFKQLAPEDPMNYRVIIAFLNQQQCLQLQGSQFQGCLKDASWEDKLPKDVEKVRKTEKDGEECLDVAGGQELQAIKAIVWSYLDTFGTRHKDNRYLDWQKRGNQHLDINRILSTVNWILYTETVGSPYNQLESSNWTCFQAQGKEKCRSDRKEIVLTGSGKILFVPLLFICQKLQNYKRECERELREVMEQSRKHYSSGEVRAYLITDQIDQYNLLYCTQSATLHKFGQ